MKSSTIFVGQVCCLIRFAAAAPPVVEVKPTILRLDGPPVKEHRRSFLLRHKGEGPMNVVSAAATDVAIAVEVKEHAAGSVYVVTATLPAGYHTPAGKSVDITVTTDLDEQPTARIPVSVRAEPPPVLDPWMARPRAMVGQPAPAATLRTIDAC